MAIETIITPRRDEDIVTSSKPTLRFITFLEALSQSIKDISILATVSEGETINVTSSTYTVLGDKNYTILCNAGATITLPASPLEKQQVNIKRLSSEVTVFGNGKNIDNESSWVITRLYANFAIEYSSTVGTWIVI